MKDRRQDLVIIGGGTGGLVAAVTAAQVGARTTLVERDRTGGDCLWTGCVPSKALLAAAHAAQTMRTADRFGIAAVEPDVDFGAVMAHVRGVQASIAPHDSPERLRGLGVTVLHGSARFTGPDTVDVEGRRLSFRRAVVATGSAPALPPIDGLADARPLTSDTVWDLDELPADLVVLGGGAIGCELGQAFRRLGSRVTLVEMADRLLPVEDPQASHVVAARLRAEGVDVLTGARATAVGDHEVTVAHVGATRAVTFSHLLVATGRRPNTDGLGLDRAGVAVTDRGHVQVDDRLRTTNDRVYAAGDVTGRLPFTHVAGQHGATATLNALFNLPRTMSEDHIPWVTFTDPEVAHVGLTVAQARDRHGDGVRVWTSELADNDRAMTARDTDGFSLLVAAPDGTLVGGTIVGPAAGEAITEVVARLAQGDKLSAVGMTTHAYPTFAEATGEAGWQSVKERLDHPLVGRLTRTALAGFRLFDRPE